MLPINTIDEAQTNRDKVNVYVQTMYREYTKKFYHFRQADYRVCTRCRVTSSRSRLGRRVVAVAGCHEGGGGARH